MGAKLGAPFETCGFIVNTPGGFWVHPVKNVHPNPEHNFEMDPEEQARAFHELNIVGVYHSHPSGPPQPSAADRKFATPGLRQFIVTTDGVYEWSPE